MTSKGNCVVCPVSGLEGGRAVFLPDPGTGWAGQGSAVEQGYAPGTGPAFTAGGHRGSLGGH